MAATVVTEVTITSAPDPFLRPSRPDPGAARARTGELYARHGRVVLGLCTALLRDRAEAEDAAQQTFLSAQRALANGSDPREPAAWLATIARNECWTRIRTRMREPLATADIDQEPGGADPVSEAIRRADLAALWKAIAELPKQQRDALLLREFGGLSYAELAEALAVTTPAVESLLFRARQGLRARLQTAYAAVSGAAWAEWAARLLAGGSAPVAAKVAVVGVSAAVVTGGAVVTPRVLHESHHPSPRLTTTTGKQKPTPTPAPILVAETPTTTARRTRAPVVAHTTSHNRGPGGGEDEHTTTTTSHRGRDGDEPAETAGGGGSSSGPGSGDERTETARGGEGTSGSDDDAATTATTTTSESGHGGGDSSGHGGGGSDGEEEVPTVTNPSVTVTITTPDGDDHSGEGKGGDG